MSISNLEKLKQIQHKRYHVYRFPIICNILIDLAAVCNMIWPDSNSAAELVDGEWALKTQANFSEAELGYLQALIDTEYIYTMLRTAKEVGD